jgi:hypothetical protein
MKFRTNKSFIKGPRKKIKNQKIKNQIEKIIYNKMELKDKIKNK